MEVKIDRIHHRNQSCLTLSFPFNEELNAQVRRIPNILFSRTHSCWYVPDQEGTLTHILSALNGKATVDLSPLQAKLQVDAEVTQQARAEEEERKILRIMEQKLHLRGYSHNTTRTYLEQFKLYLQFYRPATPPDLSETEIRNYLLYLVEKKKYSKSTQNQAINAIKFFYEQVLNQDRKVYYLERPMKEKMLPVILSEEEILRIFQHTQNLKHQLMLMLIYSGGLRRSELLGLRKGDVDVERGVLFVKGGKGKKDRQTLLAASLRPAIECYLMEFTPKYWFFEGANQKRYSESGLQAIFKKAVKKAGIIKDVHLHSLRHSFATHLLESGTSTRFIQELLGHESPITTELYTQVTRFALDKIRSPLDNMATQKLLKGNDE